MNKLEEVLGQHSDTFLYVGSSLLAYTIYSVVSYLALSYRRHVFAAAHGCKTAPKYSHADPFFGMDNLVVGLRAIQEGNFVRLIQKRFLDTAGGVNTFTSLIQGQRVVNTVEPENIKAVLSTQFKDFALPPRRKNALRGLLGAGIFTTDGREWEHSRAMLRPNFVRSQVGDIDNFEAHVAKLIRRVPTDGATVDLQELFFMLTLDSATELLFGRSTDILGEATSDDTAARFADAFQYAQETAGKSARLGWLAGLLPDARYRRAEAYCHEFVDTFVRDAVALRKAFLAKGEAKADDVAAAATAGSKRRYVFLHELAKETDDENRIRNELLNILLAGRDTTASLLSHLWWKIARRPDVFKKLREEVVGLGSERPTFEQIKDLKFLRHCVNEALRLYPVVPANNRVAIKDTTLPLGGGPDGKSPIFIKAGTPVNFFPYTMQRRKDLYGEDADEFKPERWETLRPGWEYLPFNGGPRICIGQQYALMEASYTTIRLLQAFKHIEPRDPNPWTEQLTLTLAIKTGCLVGLTPA